MTVGRISQMAVELLTQSPRNARFGQQTTELLLQQLPRVRIGQQAIEVLRSTAHSGGSTRQSILILCVTA